jgi:phage shock protein A
MPKRSIHRLMIFWLFGDNAGRVTFGIWNWLWGKSVTSGGEIAVAIANESFADIQRSVQQLTEAVAKMTATYQKVKEKYEAKQQEFQVTERQAQLAIHQEQTEAARIAMGKVLILEALLPQLKQQMLSAEKILIDNRERLQQERQRLENDRNSLESSKVLAEFNQALEQIQDIDNTIDSNSPRSQFISATTAIEDRYRQVNAMAELTKDSQAQLMSDFTNLTREDEIMRRLKELDALPLPVIS